MKKQISKIKDVWGFFATDFNFRSYSRMKSNTAQDYPDLTAEKLVNWLQSIHSDNLAWVMAKLQSGHTIFPSKVAPRMEHLSPDFYRRWCELSKAAGMYVVAYTCGGAAVHAFQQHPEWFREYGQAFACLNAPFWDREFEAVREMLGLFPADGLFYDMVMFSGNCTCEFCQAAYLKFYGKKMPERHDTRKLRAEKWNWKDEKRDTMRFRLDTWKQWVARATQAGREIVPGIEICINHQWMRPDGLPYELLEHFDWYFSEFGHAEWVGEILRAWGDKPILSGVSIEPRDCAHLQGRRMSPLGAEVFQDYRTGKLVSAEDQRVLPIKQSLDELRKCEPYVTDASAVPHAAVLYEESGNSYHAIDSEESTYTNIVATCVREATRMNLNCCTVELAERLTQDTLNKYEVLFVPDMGCMDEKLAARLHEWVAQGGVLVASGLFGLLDQRGAIRSDYTDNGLLGVRKMEGPLEVFSVLTDYRYGGKTLKMDYLASIDNVVVCAPSTAEPVGYGNVGADEHVPLIWQNKVGNGIVLYLAGLTEMGGYHQRHEKSQNAMRSCLQALLRPHIRKVPFKTSTEYPTEIWLNQQPREKRLVMHIVAFEKPLSKQKISIRADLIAEGKMELVYPAEKKAVIKGERKDGYFLFELPKVHEHLIFTLKATVH